MSRRRGHTCYLPLFLFAVTPLVTGGIALADRKAKETAIADRPLLVGYFTQGGVYNDPQYLVKNVLASRGRPLVDQINYSQGSVKDGHCSVADPNADLNFSYTSAQSVNGRADKPSQQFRGNLHQLLLLKRRFPKLRILISLEGRGADFAADAQPESRERFVRSCIDIFLRGNFAPGIRAPGIFDGIDVDWEFPHAADAANFEALLREFRRQMDAVRHGLTLSIAAGHSPAMYDGTDWEGIGRLVDQVGLMMYDFAGPWSGTTGLLAPLSISQGHRGGSVDRSVAAYLDAGVPAKKMLMGLPFYGYGWRQVPEDDNGLFQEGQPLRGDRPYSYIASLISGSTVYRDPDSAAPWLFDGDSFWTYEDPVSIGRKAKYALNRGLGGLMIWELSGDDSSSALLRAAWHGLRATNSVAEASAARTSFGAEAGDIHKPSTPATRRQR